jgi:Zn-dependent peptidase ImmA (M78 family)
MIAADILMPKKEVRRILNRGAIFDEMVKHFGVSKEAMRFRVDEVAKEEKQRTMKRGEIVEDRARSYGQAEGEQGRHAEADGLPMTPGDRV